MGKDCKNDYLDVVTIQELLKKRGFYNGVIDGNYSIEIENAIKAAQKK